MLDADATCARCVIAGWWHATLNVDEAVFMSTFVSYAAPAAAAARGGAGAAAALLPRRAGHHEGEHGETELRHRR